MPYYYFEEVQEDYEEADVVSRGDYDAAISERNEAEIARDAAITRAETAEEEARKAKKKYANAFMTTPQNVKEWHEEDVKKDGSIQSFQELFASKGETNAY